MSHNYRKGPGNMERVHSSSNSSSFYFELFLFFSLKKKKWKLVKEDPSKER